MKKATIVDIICRVLLVLCSGINAGLYFSAEKIVLGLIWTGLSVSWICLLVVSIKELRGR